MEVSFVEQLEPRRSISNSAGDFPRILSHVQKKSQNNV